MVSLKLAEFLAIAILVFLGGIRLFRFSRSPRPAEIKQAEEDATHVMRAYIERNESLRLQRRNLLDENARLLLEIQALRRRIEALEAGGSAWKSQDSCRENEVGGSGRRPHDAQTREALIALGLEPDRAYDPLAIRSAYIRAVRKSHPDQGGTDEALRRVLAAYRILVPA